MSLERTAKVDVLPGVKLTPRVLLSQVLADADALAGVIIIPIEKQRDAEDSAYMTVCHTGVRTAELALASVLLTSKVTDKVEG